MCSQVHVPNAVKSLEPGQPGVISSLGTVDGGLDGYTGWHRDMGLDRPERCQHLVVMIYFSGASVGAGATAVTPGSHLIETGPPAAEGLALEGSVPGEVGPGGAMLFDGRTWHTALPNHSDRDRETLTIRYIPFEKRSLGAVTNNAVALDALGKLNTPIRRQLLGLEYADGTHFQHSLILNFPLVFCVFTHQMMNTPRAPQLVRRGLL